MAVRGLKSQSIKAQVRWRLKRVMFCFCSGLMSSSGDWVKKSPVVHLCSVPGFGWKQHECLVCKEGMNGIVGTFCRLRTNASQCTTSFKQIITASCSVPLVESSSGQHFCSVSDCLITCTENKCPYLIGLPWLHFILLILWGPLFKRTPFLTNGHINGSKLYTNASQINYIQLYKKNIRKMFVPANFKDKFLTGAIRPPA